MKISLNGKHETIGEPIALSEFLKKLKIKPEITACELNLKIVRRKDYPVVILKEGDSLEIIQMIGGG